MNASTWRANDCVTLRFCFCTIARFPTLARSLFFIAWLQLRALPEIVWVMLSPSGRGIPLRAGSPHCCNDRRPGSGSPHPHGPLHRKSNGHPGFADPLRSGATAHSGRASLGPHHPLHPAEQRVPGTSAGLPARSRLPRPDGPVRTSGLRPRREELDTKGHRPRGTH